MIYISITFFIIFVIDELSNDRIFHCDNVNLLPSVHERHNQMQIMYYNKCYTYAFNFETITKTCPCNVYPLEPHFYIVKLGFAGVYLFFLFLLQNIDCGYSLEPPRRGGSNVYPQSMF